MDHPDYPGWQPIHVIILNEFTTSSGSLYSILTSCVDDLDISMPFLELGVPHKLAGYYPSSAVFFDDVPMKDTDLLPYMLSERLLDFLPLIRQLSRKTKRIVLDQALFFALVHHNKRRSYDHSDCIRTLVNEGANPYQSYGVDGDLIIDLAREKGVLHLFPEYLDKRKEMLSQQIILVSGNRRESELQQFSKRRLEVNEDYYSVVSLLRNRKSTHSQHVVIIIERVVDGRFEMHFIDFVKDNVKVGKGKVRHQSHIGRLYDSLLLSCHLKLMRINDVDDLECLPPWQITNAACQNLLDAIDLDKHKSIDYVVLGDRSIFAWSSLKKGHSCYTWAREKLLAIGDVFVEESLKPTFEEWLGSLPSRKVKNKSQVAIQPLYKNRHLLFGMLATTIAIGTYAYYNVGNDSPINPFSNH